MEPWALREHVWVLRGLCAAGFALMGWGAYLEKSPIVFAGIAAVAVSCWFWRISGYTTLSAGPRGVDLSGGEWQKLALARAYLRDAQLLILDEPTAALDARSEYEVFQRFAELTEGKMALLISHRFSTVRMADSILVLADGKIAEVGNHAELVSRGGRYSEMFELQASSYR